jgi:hypothetical protein
MPERPWFRPKSFGYGATPVTWEGWLLTLASMVLTMAGMLGAVFVEIQHWPNRRPFQAFCLIVAAGSIVGMTIIARRKTEGDWR